jgi:hypothetical protein
MLLEIIWMSCELKRTRSRVYFAFLSFMFKNWVEDDFKWLELNLRVNLSSLFS